MLPAVGLRLVSLDGRSIPHPLIQDRPKTLGHVATIPGLDVASPRLDRIGLVDPIGRLSEIAKLPDGWDGDNAPRPDDAAVGQAMRLINWLRAEMVVISDVGPDVMGGVAIFAQGTTGDKDAWFACMNGGAYSVVLSDSNGVSSSAMLGDTVREQALRFLNG
jgi:hypothetical protein